MPQPLATHEWTPALTEEGAVPPVAVLVHGITGWWRTWWRLGPALAERGWRVIALDQRGHGESPPIDGVATAETFAADIALTLEQLGIVPVDLLLGHSLGAAVSMELAHRRHEIARRLAIEDPPGGSRVDDTEFQTRLEQEVLAARATPDHEVRRELAENPAWLPEDARQDVEGKQRCDLDGILASLRHGTGLRAVELAARIAIPSLYMLADRERSVIGARRRDLIESLPESATLAEFDSGHTVHRDRFDAYLDTLLTWLADG